MQPGGADAWKPAAAAARPARRTRAGTGRSVESVARSSFEKARRCRCVSGRPRRTPYTLSRPGAPGPVWGELSHANQQVSCLCHRRLLDARARSGYGRRCQRRQPGPRPQQRGDVRDDLDQQPWDGADPERQDRPPGPEGQHHHQDQESQRRSPRRQGGVGLPARWWHRRRCEGGRHGDDRCGGHRLLRTDGRCAAHRQHRPRLPSPCRPGPTWSRPTPTSATRR